MIASLDFVLKLQVHLRYYLTAMGAAQVVAMAAACRLRWQSLARWPVAYEGSWQSNTWH
jgi:hypothetical protein